MELSKKEKATIMGTREILFEWLEDSTENGDTMRMMQVDVCAQVAMGINACEEILKRDKKKK